MIERTMSFAQPGVPPVKGEYPRAERRVTVIREVSLFADEPWPPELRRGTSFLGGYGGSGSRVVVHGKIVRRSRAGHVIVVRT